MTKRLPDKLDAMPVSATVYHQPIRPLKPYWRRARSGPAPMAPEDKLETLSLRVTAAQRSTVHRLGVVAIRAWLDAQAVALGPEEPELNPPSEADLKRHAKEVRRQKRNALLKVKPLKWKDQ